MHLIQPLVDFIRPGCFRIVTVQMPTLGVVVNVFPYAIEGIIITNDVFVIIALPDGLAGGAMLTVDAPGNGSFKGPENGW